MIDASPSIVPITMTFDTTNTFEFVLFDERGQAVDLSAVSVVFTVKDEKGGTTLFQKINTSTQHTNPTKGQSSVTLVPGDITPAPTLEETIWVYEVRRIVGTDEHVHIEGDFTVLLAVGD